MKNGRRVAKTTMQRGQRANVSSKAVVIKKWRPPKKSKIGEARR